MKLNMFSKNEDLSKSAPFVGALILKFFDVKKAKKISIFEIARELKKSKSIGVRSIYYGMIFLYSLDMIDFNEPYVIIKNVKN